MLISVGVRCLNEEELLPVFLDNHQFADEIVIVDGGSTDSSRDVVVRYHYRYQLASPLETYAPIRWVNFPERVRGKHGGWRNPEGKHVNTVIDNCLGDWLWITEMDALPSIPLQENIRDIIAKTGKKAIGSYLYYLAPWSGSYEHFPALIQGHGLTCWHKSLNLRADPDEDFTPIIKYEADWEALEPPMARVHLSWRTDEVFRAKEEFYRRVHDMVVEPPDTQYSREPLPDWLVWKGMEGKQE